MLGIWAWPVRGPVSRERDESSLSMRVNASSERMARSSIDSRVWRKAVEADGLSTPWYCTGSYLSSSRFPCGMTRILGAVF